ncbi:MAG: DUF554 domain-containing protein [Erysipelotrichaceae bacterium]|nr:DUF554 domain-containing protein [Erysipelotrichaceae bacterium]
MFALGTIINTIAIILGGFFGLLFGSKLNEKQQDGLIKASGVSVLFIGIAGAMEKMLTIQGLSLISSNSLLIVICLALGAFIGELLHIEEAFEKFGEWLKQKSGNQNENNFVYAFVNASFTVCIGAMAIVGAIQDGIYHDSSVLVTKSLLDFIIIMIMSCSTGKGAIFSAVPVFLLQGSMTVLASLLEPLMTDLALMYLSLVGSILIFCVGVNLVWGKKVSVANMLPSLLIAVIASFII